MVLFIQDSLHCKQDGLSFLPPNKLFPISYHRNKNIIPILYTGGSLPVTIETRTSSGGRNDKPPCLQCKLSCMNNTTD